MIRARKSGVLLLSILTLLATNFSPSYAEQVNLTYKAFDQRLSQYNYPFPVYLYQFTSQKQKLEMAYMDLPGSKPDLPTLVLLHGKNFNGAYWEQTAKALNEQGYRVIIPDQVGFGKSSKPSDYQYTFQALAQNTQALLKAANVKDAILIGHSMGGMLATRYSLMYPEQVEKLLLINPLGLEDWKTVVPYPSIDAWYQQELKQTREGLIQYQKTNYYGNQWNANYERWIVPQAGWLQGPDKKHLAWVSAKTYDMIFTQPVLYEFSRLSMPTLLIIGARDKTALGKNLAPSPAREQLGNYKALAPYIVEQIPEGKLVFIPNVGHLPQIEKFSDVIDAINSFLQSN